jgi:SAM-dependent methyltransferase
MKNILEFEESVVDSSKVDIDAINFYSGLLDRNGMELLFPDLSKGCINFGYWEYIPKIISKSERLLSQIKLYQKIISRFEPTKSQIILEVGCGRGHGVQMLLNSGMDAFGVDAVPSQIKICRENYPNDADRFIHGYAGHLPFQNESFDGIISLEAKLLSKQIVGLSNFHKTKMDVRLYAFSPKRDLLVSV